MPYYGMRDRRHYREGTKTFSREIALSGGGVYDVELEDKTHDWFLDDEDVDYEDPFLDCLQPLGSIMRQHGLTDAEIVIEYKVEGYTEEPSDYRLPTESETWEEMSEYYIYDHPRKIKIPEKIAEAIAGAYASEIEELEIEESTIAKIGQNITEDPDEHMDLL